MQFVVTGRHVEITDPMRRYAEEKTGKLTRYYDRIEGIEVIVDHESIRQRVELVIRTNHRQTLVGHVEADDYYEAIDLVVDKLGRQLKRHKERQRNRKHSGKHTPSERGSPGT